MDCTPGQVRPHKTLKCVIPEPGPGAEVKIAKPGKQCTGTRGLRHKHGVLRADQNPQSNAKVACCLVTLSRRNTGLADCVLGLD